MTKLKKWLNNRDTILSLIVLIISVSIVIGYHIISFNDMVVDLILQYKQSEWLGIFVTIFLLIPIFVTIYVPFKLVESWKESDKW
jgi:hypothetical protein